MPELSNAEAALLGLLSEKSMYPYQIEKEVKYREMRFWTELSMSSIYKLLRKLEKEEFVERTDKISPENRLQKFYSVSKKGKSALKDKIIAILSSSEHVRWQIDIGTYNCTLLSPHTIKVSLHKYREDLIAKIKSYKELLGFLKESNCPGHRYAIAQRPIYLLKAEIVWIDSFIKELEV